MTETVLYCINSCYIIIRKWLALIKEKLIMLHHNDKLDLSMDAHKHFLFQNNLLCVLYIDGNNCGIKFSQI